MSKNPNYETLWEMVYHNPKEIKETPARLLLKLNKNNPDAILNENIFSWLEEHKDEIARAVIKAIKNRTGSSKYQFITVFKVPFYKDYYS